MLFYITCFTIITIVTSDRSTNDGNGDFLVTMTPKEYVKIMSCIAKCGDERTQNEYEECEQKAPKQTIKAMHVCERKILGTDESRYNQIQAKDPELIYEMHECVKSKADEYTDDDKDKAEIFENCCRDIYDDACGRQRRLRRVFRISRPSPIPRWLRIPSLRRPFERRW